MTLVTIEPLPDPAAALLGLVFKPPEAYVTYRYGFRLAQNPLAVGLMLNAPVPHPAFSSMPDEPFPTISANYAARFEFKLVDVAAGS
jgi:hypothetical protein